MSRFRGRGRGRFRGRGRGRRGRGRRSWKVQRGYGISRGGVRF